MIKPKDSLLKGTNIPRLYIRRHSYYIRVALPENLWKLAKKKEIRYTLNTNNYYQAIKNLHKESLKIDLLIDLLQELDMELKNNKVILTDMEINQVFVYLMRLVDDKCENNYNAIRSGKYPWEEIGYLTDEDVKRYNEEHFDANAPDEQAKDSDDFNFLRDRIEKILMQYLEWLKEKPSTKISVQEIIEKIQTDHCAFFQLTDNDAKTQRTNQMMFFVKQLQEIEKYARGRYLQTKGELSNLVKTPFIENLEGAMKFQKYQEMSGQPQMRNSWEDVFEDMVRPVKHVKKVSLVSIAEKKKCLATLFELIDKKYVQDIDYEDCKTVNRLIYRIPKKWQLKNPDKKLLDVLLPESDDELNPEAISARTVSKYLQKLAEFLRYCRKQRYIDKDLADLLDLPSVNKGDNCWSRFTDNDLRLIFNPKTYFRQTVDGDDPKYWVPLISLYSGMRLNEICQIRLDDIKQEDGVWYIQITDEHPLQSLKTKQSKRRVPIHPKLKELGFLQQVSLQQWKKKEFLFSSLKYNKKNKFGGAISNAFRHYLDATIKLQDNRKVFHSFRHTVKPLLRDAGVSTEFVDILCGWEGNGSTGTKNYAHKDSVPMKKLHRQLSKLKYPCLDDYWPILKNRSRKRPPIQWDKDTKKK